MCAKTCFGMNETTEIRALGSGFNQQGVRDYNERLILSTLLRHGDMPGSDIARRTHLSAQTISVILRKLESDGLLSKGAPVKGKVGKPSVPMKLNATGAYSVGFKIGRRSSEMFLMDFCGEVLLERRCTYDIALPTQIFEFLKSSFEAATDALEGEHLQRLSGIGIAVPLEIWKWGASDGNTPEAFLSWKDVDFSDEISKFTDLPVFMVNDATSGCWAEHVFGRGKEFSDYAYIFVSTFIGGGIVINQSVYEGPNGNAGALGPLRVGDAEGRNRQLMDVASVHVLEDAVRDAGLDPRGLWTQPQNWAAYEQQVVPWLDSVAYGIAQACLSICSVIDFDAVVIDGAVPVAVRQRLVTAVHEKLQLKDSRGLILPRIEEGSIGSEARAIGAACVPIFEQYFLNANPKLAD